MSVKTVRFNKNEEALLRKILSHYGRDFSACVKELLMEKMEDLQDLGFIKRIKEGKQEDYFTARELNAMFPKR